jgi:hypothetical protein
MWRSKDSELETFVDVRQRAAGYQASRLLYRVVLVGVGVDAIALPACDYDSFEVVLVVKGLVATSSTAFGISHLKQSSV